MLLIADCACGNLAIGLKCYERIGVRVKLPQCGYSKLYLSPIDGDRVSNRLAVAFDMQKQR